MATVRFRCGLALVLTLLEWSSWAQRVQLTPDQKEKAQQIYASGVRKYNLGRFEEAARDFEAVYDLTGNESFLFNIAQSFRFAKNHDRAIFFYKSYLRTNPPDRQDIEKRINDETEILRQQDAAAPQPPAKPEARPAAPATSSPPTRTMQAPIAAPAADTGKSNRRFPWIVAGSVLAAVGIGLGAAAVGTGVTAHDDYDSLVSRCGPTLDLCPDGYQATRDQGRALDVSTWVLASVGAAALITGVTLLTVGVRRSRVARVRAAVAPSWLRGGGGIAVGAQF